MSAADAPSQGIPVGVLARTLRPRGKEAVAPWHVVEGPTTGESIDIDAEEHGKGQREVDALSSRKRASEMPRWCATSWSNVSRTPRISASLLG